MPGSVEKRSVPRIPIKLPFLYQPKTPERAKSGTGWTHDLSEEGACLELPNRLAKGSTIRLLFQTDRFGLDLVAVVAWTAMLQQKGEGVLHGVSFSDLTPVLRQVLQDLVRSEGQGDKPS